jgi:hypothetical protein
MWHRPIIDAVTDRERYDAFLEDRLNPKACPSCGLKVGAGSPTLVRTPHWVAIALENPSPIPVSKAYEIVATLTSPLFDVAAADAPPILVVGRSEELRRIIANKKSDPFCAIAFDLLLLPNHAILIEILAAISDAYLDAKMPEGAYWIFPEAIGEFNELYFHRLVYERAEMTALAAGDRIFPYLNTPQKAADHFRHTQGLLEPRRANLPDWGASVYLCFYEQGPHTKWLDNRIDAGTSLVDLLQLAPDGSFDIGGAEKHLAFVPLQAIIQQEPAPDRKAFGLMLALMLGSNAIRHLGQVPRDTQSLLEIASMHFRIMWDQLSQTQQEALAKRYSDMTGGLNLRAEFQFK